MLTILFDSNSGKMLSRLQNCRTTLPQGSNHLPFESSRAPRSRDRDCAVFGPRASKPTSVAIPTGALGIEGFPNSVSRPSTPTFQKRNTRSFAALSAASKHSRVSRAGNSCHAAVVASFTKAVMSSEDRGLL